MSTRPPSVFTYFLTIAYSWEDGSSDPSDFRLRIDQLAFRRREIHIAYNAFRRLVKEGHRTSGDDGVHIETIDESLIDWESWSGGNGGPVQCEDVTLAGHSFGGATVVGFSSVLFAGLVA